MEVDQLSFNSNLCITGEQDLNARSRCRLAADSLLVLFPPLNLVRRPSPVGVRVTNATSQALSKQGGNCNLLPTLGQLDHVTGSDQ